MQTPAACTSPHALPATRRRESPRVTRDYVMAQLGLAWWRRRRGDWERIRHNLDRLLASRFVIKWMDDATKKSSKCDIVPLRNKTCWALPRDDINNKSGQAGRGKEGSLGAWEVGTPTVSAQPNAPQGHSLVARSPCHEEHRLRSGGPGGGSTLTAVVLACCWSSRPEWRR